MYTNDGFQGVSNCYVFKSRLQEYAQKVGLPTPVYETIKEGPSHEPSFRSTVIVDNVRYDSLSGFFNRKAAEQSAAEVALVKLAKSLDIKERVSQPVHETGLCKNLLQEYAQKMNYAIPLYECQKDEKQTKVPLFSCTVEIGGIKYIGAAARTKKEAEIKAARTALLAIQSSAYESNEKHTDNSLYTVIPCKKVVADLGVNSQEIDTSLKPKKGRFKKKPCKRRRALKRANNIQVENTANLEVTMNGRPGQELDQVDASEVPVADSELLATKMMRTFQDETRSFDGKERNLSAIEDPLVPHNNVVSKDGKLTTLNLNVLVKEVNKFSGVGHVALAVNNSSTCQGEVPSIMDGLNRMAGNSGSN